MNGSTSIGPGPDKGGNEDTGNADGLGNKTFGNSEMPEPELRPEPAKQIPPPSESPELPG